ncbi:MAG: hypothetical protein H0W08_23590 [Acidobacteria bacterium]|nr:hypothetical protein [Acidobacteriota bacterium]
MNRQRPSTPLLDADGRWIASGEHLQLTPSLSQVAGAAHLRARIGTGRMGAVKYGAPGGAPQAAHNLLAIPVIEHLARELNVSEDEAKRLYYAMGRVMQRLVLEGRPVGIPHVGVVHIVEVFQSAAKCARVTASKHRAARRELRDPTAHAKLGRRPEALIAAANRTLSWQAQTRVRKVRFVQPLALRRLFTDNGCFSGPWREHLREIRESVSRQRGVTPKQHRLRRHEQAYTDKTGAQRTSSCR